MEGKRNEHYCALHDRATAALKAMYHNATLSFEGIKDEDWSDFHEWVSFTAEVEIQELNEGGAYGSDEIMGPYIRGKYKSPAAQRRAWRMYEDNKRHEQNECARHERIIEYGKIYTWGRGGRTIGPDRLITGQMYWRIDYEKADLPFGDLTDLVLTVEAWNEFVEEWCAGIVHWYYDEKKERAANDAWEAEQERKAMHAYACMC